MSLVRPTYLAFNGHAFGPFDVVVYGLVRLRDTLRGPA